MRHRSLRHLGRPHDAQANLDEGKKRQLRTNLLIGTTAVLTFPVAVEEAQPEAVTS